MKGSVNEDNYNVFVVSRGADNYMEVLILDEIVYAVASWTLPSGVRSGGIWNATVTLRNGMEKNVLFSGDGWSRFIKVLEAKRK